MANVNLVDIIEFDLGTRHVPFDEALALQRSIHSEVSNGTREPTLILLEHQPIYTIGVRSREHELPPAHLPQTRVDRGGKVTWHGPGQLVAYPIVPLGEPLDVVAYIRALELAVVQTCADFALDAQLVPGRSGVWLPHVPSQDSNVDSVLSGSPAKVCAVGARVQQRVTLHGLALNCSNSLEPYTAIIPCGITDASVTTLSSATHQTITPQSAAESLTHNIVGNLKELGIS